jgi:hypothetical protein
MEAAIERAHVAVRRAYHLELAGYPDGARDLLLDAEADLRAAGLDPALIAWTMLIEAIAGGYRP